MLIHHLCILYWSGWQHYRHCDRVPWGACEDCGNVGVRHAVHTRSEP